MSVFREIPPSAGFPVHFRDFLSVFKPYTEEDPLENDFKNYLNVPYARITNSGTAALYLILEALKTLSPRKTVIIPSYICPLVPLAIKRAGLKVEVCDIGGDDFDFHRGELEELCTASDDVLAVIAAHIGGIPLDLDSIGRAAKRNGAFLIEDCAQSLGAKYKGKLTGTIGDVSFFSLCRGKGLTIYEGGAVVTPKKELAEPLDSAMSRLAKDDYFLEGLRVLQLFGYWIFYRPRLLWFVFRLPQIFWSARGERLRALAEDFSIDFPVHKVSKMRRAIANSVFPRLDAEIAKQRECAARYIEALIKIEGIKVAREPSYGWAIYPYITLIFDEPEVREKALGVFEGSGLGVFQIYASAIADYEYLKEIVPDRHCAGGRYLAKRAMSLSTSIFLKDKDLACVVDKIKDVCYNAGNRI